MNISKISGLFEIPMINKTNKGTTKAIPNRTILEKGQNGELGVWTRDGEDAFFTPLSEINEKAVLSYARQVMMDNIQAKDAYSKSCFDKEPAEAYEKRKKCSTEWCM